MRENIKRETNSYGQDLSEKTPGRIGNLNLALGGRCDKKINAYAYVCGGASLF